MPARFPFLEDRPVKPPAAPLDIVEHAARHNVYSPLCCPVPRQLMSPKRPFDIKLPWLTETFKSSVETSKSFMEQVLAEYREGNPDANKPTSIDLIRWYRQRAIDAEMHSGGLDREVNRLEEVQGRLEREISQMAIDVRIRSASHGI